ncbi:unnamed protein product [Adineta steineri]|uniref:Uncharacterized protein n=2 Tax=Adineta steineri TaxID=433720 RepID=A0A819FVZ8_9BILA|nr:unnamed protein product [Adineta steineri]
MTGQPSMVSELASLTSASKTVERSTTVSYSYVTDWYINLIRAFQEVPPAQSCKKKFVEECCILYEHNPTILQTIKEFSNTYVPEEAIRWYTRDGFLYKVLNRVLREKNQQTIQLLHFLIYDLNRQLKNEIKMTPQNWMKADTVRLYRGQLMSMDELQQLRNNKGEELFVNSFLSLTTDLAVANMFSGAGAFGLDSPMQSVIFHIEWAAIIPTQGPANIERLSFNRDEGEILLSPTYTVNFLDCVYDEQERVWNATFSRIAQTDDPLIRISDDERLMKLELILRYLLEEKDSLDDDTEDMLDTSSVLQDGEFEFTRKFCSTFVEDVPILLRELKLPELCSVTLNDDSSDRFHLRTLRSFTADALDHGPKIEDDIIVTLYDALGGVFKMNGKLMEAYYYYQKASIYDKPQSQTTYTRQAHLAQIHKLNGNYELAWNIFNELMDRTNDADNFLYDDADNDVEDDNDADDDDNDDHDDDDDSEHVDDERMAYVIEAWAELGYRQNKNKYSFRFFEVLRQMATAKNKAQCFVCNKEKNTYDCKGCSKEFCFQHLTEHRQILDKQLDEIINDHDQFQHTIIQQKQNPQNASLIQQIDQWEKNSIEKIQQTAQQCRETLMKSTEKSINDVEKKFIELSKKLKEIREENEFNELDLNHFQLQLKQITKEFVTPSNISIRQDSQEFIKKILVISSFETIQIKKNKFQQFAITVAGGSGKGHELNQLSDALGIFIDNDKSVYIADSYNHRIVKWKLNSVTGQIIAGGNQNNQLNYPTNIIFDKKNNSFIISEWGNKRIIRCFGQTQQTIISNIRCTGLTIDKNGFIYVSDWDNHEVRRWKQGDTEGELVAGGNGYGNHLNQLNVSTFIFIDDEYSLYISDNKNHRVMKWKKDAKEGIIVAGGNGQGNSLRQLSSPQGVFADHSGQIYVADEGNNRLMRWCEGDKEGEIVVSTNVQGNQLNCPTGLSFDNDENLYVVDRNNHRVLKYKQI